MQNLTATQIKIISQRTLRLGICTLQFGVFTEKLTDKGKSTNVMIKFSGKEPEQIGDTADVLSLGFKIVSYGERLGIGLIKRKQTIQKVQ
ncbi:hypothetical protein TH53_04630 [Pedobacter lusitanus]|uniref:Uncharacterized protein n=1 Tax=Pedobacter lusitanus TaxID=1503925 RepID=A0A0D0GV78_9SPHI|nr:hypothetical protein [Pedobacter lusitanus]KIO78301.1 hypothetical protein TH53_04630 [Pedobacter lusitanus]